MHGVSHRDFRRPGRARSAAAEARCNHLRLSDDRDSLSGRRAAAVPAVAGAAGSKVQERKFVAHPASHVQ